MATNQLAQSDSFLSGSLAGGWSAWPNLSLPSVVVGTPNVIQPTAISTSDGVYWTGQSWANDQIVECTINNLASTGGAAVTLGARIIANVSGHPQGYQVVILPTTPTVAIQSFSGGSATTLKSIGGISVAAGDVWTFAAIGTVLLVYQNGTRIGYVADTNFTGGAPGVFVQSNSSNANTAQVSSIRLYNVQQADGIWTKQGCILLGNSTEMGGSPAGLSGLSVNYGASVFLNPGNNVYRGYWVYRNSTTPEVAYAESSDGKTWSRYSSNPVISGFGGGCVNWIGGTAYMYGQATPGGTNTVTQFTSTDGVTWTNAGNCTGLSVAGYSNYSICALTKISGTFYGLWGGLNTSTQDTPATFLATSTDGLTWSIQNSGSPVIAGAFCGCNMFQANGTYYLPTTSNQSGQGSGSSANFDPVTAVLYQSTNLTTWTLNGTIINNSLISDSWNNPNGGCAPLCMINVGGNAYLYYQGSPSDATSPADYQCMLATAPSTLANIVQKSQTATVQVASDAFTNGNGPLSASWTTPSWSVGALQIVSGPFVEPNTLSGSRCVALYTGSSFGRNQYCQVTLQTLTGTVGRQILSLLLLAQSGSQSAYYCQIPCPTASQTTSNNLQIINSVSGTFHVLTGSTTPNQITPHVGDVFLFACTTGSDGSNILTLYQNGIQVLQAQDYAATYTSGSPGLQMNALDALNDVQISAWAGGSTASIPTYVTWQPLVFHA